MVNENTTEENMVVTPQEVRDIVDYDNFDSDQHLTYALTCQTNQQRNYQYLINKEIKQQNILIVEALMVYFNGFFLVS